MDQHDKNWKDKFNMKHNAKKEMLELKHKQKMEIEEQNEKKKNWFQRIEEERRKTKQLEIEEQKRREEERKKNIKIRIIITILLVILGVAMMITGIILVEDSGDSDSMWNMLIFMGVLPLLGIAVIWGTMVEDNKKKKRK